MPRTSDVSSRVTPARERHEPRARRQGPRRGERDRESARPRRRRPLTVWSDVQRGRLDASRRRPPGERARRLDQLRAGERGPRATDERPARERLGPAAGVPPERGRRSRRRHHDGGGDRCAGGRGRRSRRGQRAAPGSASAPTRRGRRASVTHDAGCGWRVPCYGASSCGGPFHGLSAGRPPGGGLDDPLGVDSGSLGRPGRGLRRRPPPGRGEQRSSSGRRSEQASRTPAALERSRGAQRSRERPRPLAVAAAGTARPHRRPRCASVHHRRPRGCRRRSAARAGRRRGRCRGSSAGG